ncbi:putative MFS family arabinose efflux permease [Sphingobacterium alimentarium]|uniref:Putative MFS family arabinose efflux permease n=1 Tax=Sphingobacterium alimentarium TaxID=797292 RepID=A0A4R3VQX7_9SPHI|nr:MFS transporter [Sphingobacterium alimentarium]TCV09868.1 putative MFS family arabinose efflux permease [Sphingobacterium alimentarium]
MKNSKHYPWVVVGLLWFVALLNYMDRQILSTMRPAIAQDILDLESAAVFGNLMAVFLWIYGCMSPIAGVMADKINRKGLIISSLFVWSGVTFAMGYATSYDQLYALRAVMGVSEAIYIPAGLSLIADYHTDKSRSLAVGIHMTGLYFGQALGGFGATVASRFSWQHTFIIFGLIGILYAVVLIFTLFETPARDKPEKNVGPQTSIWKGIPILFSNIAFWVILLYFAVPSLPGWATKNWLPTLFADNLNIPMETAGPLSTITIAFSSFLGVISGGILSDRWVQKNIKGRIYTSAIGLALTIPAVFLIGYGSSIWAIVGAGLIFGFGFGMFDANNMPILCQFVAAKYRATAYGIMNMVGVFAGAYITKVLGASADEGNLGSDFALLAVIVFVVLIIQLSVLRPKQHDQTI